MITFTTKIAIAVILGITAFGISFIAFHGEMLLKCPKCKKRGRFKRAKDPIQTERERIKQNKINNADLLDSKIVSIEPNSIICSNCKHEIKLT